ATATGPRHRNGFGGRVDLVGRGAECRRSDPGGCLLAVVVRDGGADRPHHAVDVAAPVAVYPALGASALSWFGAKPHWRCRCFQSISSSAPSSHYRSQPR